MKNSPAVLKWIFFILLAGVLIEALYLSFYPSPRQPEPQYQGRKLTEWARDIDQSDFFRQPQYQQHEAKSEQAIAAVQHIGTNALPMALDLLAAKDSWFKKKIEKWAQRYDDDDWPGQRRFPIYIKSAGEKNYEGANIIWALGPVTKPIIPSLMQLFQSPNEEIAANMMYALPGAGTNVVPPLIRLLGSTNKDIRIRAAIILGRHFGSQAHAAVPVLLQGLDEPTLNPIQRVQVIFALVYIRQDASVIVPSIVRHIQNETNKLFLWNYSRALQNLETNKNPAVRS
jgi:hypothetical protein